MGVSVKNCDINLDNWEKIATDCAAWNNGASIFIATMKQTRNEKAAWRRVIHKVNAVFPSTDGQPTFH